MRTVVNICILTLVAGLVLTSCVGNPKTRWWSNKEEPNRAVVGLSPNYPVNSASRIVVLPFQNIGRDGVDAVLGDKFAMHCMDIGFVVVDRVALQGVLPKPAFDDLGKLSVENLKAIGAELHVDLVVVGTANYDQGEDSSGALISEGVKFLDAKTGEVMLSAWCDRLNQRSISEEISRQLQARLLSRNLPSPPVTAPQQ